MYEGILLRPNVNGLASLLIGIAHVLIHSLHHCSCQEIALEAASLDVTSLLAIIFETLYFDKIIHDVQPYRCNPGSLSVNSFTFMGLEGLT